MEGGGVTRGRAKWIEKTNSLATNKKKKKKKSKKMFNLKKFLIKKKHQIKRV